MNLLRAVARTQEEWPLDLREVRHELVAIIQFVERSLATGHLKSKFVRKAVATLAYLRNPYDHIFDLHVEGGFADDVDEIRKTFAMLPLELCRA